MRPPANVSGPPVPIQEAVGEFVAALVGKGAAATKVSPTPIERDGDHVVGAYQDKDGRVAALSIADLSFAAYTGAALGMIPAQAAGEEIARGELSETLLENYQEVANIMASLVNSPSSPHLTLSGTWTTADESLPGEAWSVIASPGKRREFAVTIEGYGDGRVGIIIR